MFFDFTWFIAPPFVAFYASMAIYGIALSLPYLLRWLCLLPMLYLDYIALDGCYYWPEEGLDSLWGLLICIWAVQSTCFLVLEPHDSLVIQGKGPYQQQSWRVRFWATWNNPRLLFTSREEIQAQIKHSETKSKQESRWTFAIRRSAKILVYWLVCKQAKRLILPGLFQPLYAMDFDETRQTLLRRMHFFHQDPDPITLREIALRSVFSVYWAGAAYIFVDGGHSALSLIFVVFRANQPHEWPPIYGSLYQATNLRRFWGQFWHRIVVVHYGNIGRVLSERCFGFRSNSLPYKLIIASCIFGLSGVAHAVVAWQLGDSNHWQLDIYWFLMNFAACAAESLVSSAYKSFLRKAKSVQVPVLKELVIFLESSSTRKVIGYTWVFFFFFWSVPKWQYPRLHSALSLVEGMTKLREAIKFPNFQEQGLHSSTLAATAGS